MVLITPNKRAADLLILEDHIKRLTENPTLGENVFDKINKEMDKLVSGSDQVVLTMPEFTVEGDLKVNSIMEKVELCKYSQKIKLFLCPKLKNPVITILLFV